MASIAHAIGMKKLINSPECRARGTRGDGGGHADRLRVSYEPVFIARRDAPINGKVGLVSVVAVTNRCAEDTSAGHA